MTKSSGKSSGSFGSVSASIGKGFGSIGLSGRGMKISRPHPVEIPDCLKKQDGYKLIELKHAKYDVQRPYAVSNYGGGTLPSVYGGGAGVSSDVGLGRGSGGYGSTPSYNPIPGSSVRDYNGGVGGC